MMRESMVCRFVTGFSVALIALSFTAGAVAHNAPSELKTTVVISLTSSAQPNISMTVYNNGNTAASELVRKVSMNDFHFVKKTDTSSAK